MSSFISVTKRTANDGRQWGHFWLFCKNHQSFLLYCPFSELIVVLIGGQATSKLSLKSPMKIVLMLKPQSDSTYVLLHSLYRTVLRILVPSSKKAYTHICKKLYTDKVIFKLQELQI